MKGRLIAVKINDAVIEDNEMWASCDEFNGLVYTNLQSDKTKFIGRFPGLPSFIRHAFTNVVKLDDILVFIPGIADAVYTYHIVKREFRQYALPKEMGKLMGKLKFAQAVVYGKNVIMMGYGAPCIVYFNIQDGSMFFYDEWYQNYIQQGFSHELLLVEREICIVGNRLFFPPRNGDCIVEFDMEQRMCFFHEFRYQSDWYFNLYYEDGFFWTYGAKKKVIIQINDKFEVLEEWSLLEMKPYIKNKLLMEENCAWFRFIYKKANFIWLFSYNFANYVQIDIETRNLCMHSQMSDEEYDSFSFINLKHIQNMICVFEPMSGSTYIYNEEMKKIKTLRIRTDQTDAFKFLDDGIEEYFLGECGQHMNLNYLIWNMLNESGFPDKEKKYRNGGDRIWKVCKGV